MQNEQRRVFFAGDRQAWRAWLAEHAETEKEIWLAFPPEASDEAGLTFCGAAEEALRFGWTDSTADRPDAPHGLRRFTPRTADAADTSAEMQARLLAALNARHFAELRCGNETYLIQLENNKGWDYVSIWRSTPKLEGLGRVLFDVFDGVDTDTVREVLRLPCIHGKSLLQLRQSGKLEWL